MENVSTSKIENFTNDRKGRDIRLLLVVVLAVVFAIVFVMDLLGIAILPV